MTPEKLSQRLHREAKELQQIYHQLIGVGTLRAAHRVLVVRRTIGDLANQALKRQLTNEQFCRFLVSTDFSECDSSWPVPVRFLYTSR